MKTTQTTITAGDVVIKTDDKRTITVTLHKDRIFVGVSGLGIDSRLETRQITANGVGILIKDTGVVPALVNHREIEEGIREQNTKRIGDMSS